MQLTPKYSALQLLFISMPFYTSSICSPLTIHDTRPPTHQFWSFFEFQLLQLLQYSPNHHQTDLFHICTTNSIHLYVISIHIVLFPLTIHEARRPTHQFWSVSKFQFIQLLHYSTNYQPTNFSNIHNTIFIHLHVILLHIIRL